MMRSLLAAAAVAALISAETRAQEPDTREFISYVWTSGIDGRAGIGDRVGNVDASFDDLADFVDVGGTVRFRSTSDPYGWFVEGTYIRLSNTVDALPVAARVEFTRRLGELGVTRTLVRRLSGYLGLRAQELDTELRTAVGQTFGADTNWVDGIVGLYWTPIQSPTWRAWVRGDVGAGGADSVWLAEVGGGYHFGDRWTAYLAYRVLSTDYEGGGIVYDVDESGIAFGFGLSFR